MTYDHQQFIDELKARRNDRAYERIVRDLGNNTAIVACQYPDEDPDTTEFYGTWEHDIADWHVDRKDQVLYGEYTEKEYRYITRSADRAEQRALKRAKRDGFQLDTSSDHCAEWYIERDGNYTVVTFTGFLIASDDVWVYSRFDSHRDYRYFDAHVENKYTDASEAERIEYILQDHHRMEELCNQDWSPVYAIVTAYYKGEEIGDTSQSGFESDDDSGAWIEETLSDLDIEQLIQDKIADLMQRLDKLTE
jgi:hypothetical protein